MTQEEFEVKFANWSKDFDDVDLDNLTPRQFKNFCYWWWQTGYGDGLQRGIDRLDAVIAATAKERNATKQ